MAKFNFYSVSVTALAVGLALSSCDQSAPPTAGAAPTMRLLSESQYRNTIADLFGAQITVGGSFDPLIRTNGLLTVGATNARITPAGLEQLDRMARSIASQVVVEKNRAVLIPCVPASQSTADDACATKFYATVGRLLYRHPLSSEESKARLRLPMRLRLIWEISTRA